MREVDRARHARDIHAAFGIEDGWLTPSMKWGPPNTMAHTAGKVQVPPVEHFRRAMRYQQNDMRLAMGYVHHKFPPGTSLASMPVKIEEVMPTPERDPIPIPDYDYDPEYDPSVHAPNWFVIGWVVFIVAVFTFIGWWMLS